MKKSHFCATPDHRNFPQLRHKMTSNEKNTAKFIRQNAYKEQKTR
jgi:hypothetical protein